MAQSEKQHTDTAEDHSGEAAQGFEWWARIALVLAALAALNWLAIFLRLGEVSVVAHAFLAPAFGWLTLPVIVWGVMRTVRHQPIYRHSRTIAFALLLAVAFFGNAPIFSVPLSTEGFESEHDYRLPFEGEWITTAGGPLETNYHATNPFYRWGFDFTRVRDGKRYEGQGESLDDYYCFGEPVLSSVAGEVAVMRNQRKDSPPREFDPNSILGNFVVIQVEQDEYLFVAHMKKGSIPVEEGDSVEKGQKIGECGNSGRAVEPHVHVHLQNALTFPSETSEGITAAESLPLRFSNYLADGDKVERGMPRGGISDEQPLGERVEPQN
ncbi:MAG: M23 family metallopeptidase [Myxococcota bacterium]